jgi:RND family efflux transporter MFP subunit
MLDTAVEEIVQNKKRLPAGSLRTKEGFVKLIAVSGVAMSLLLPLGIIPRIMQASEVPSVSVTPVISAPPQQKLSLPGTIEAIIETPIYARSNGYIEHFYVDIGDHVSAGQLLAKMQTPEIEDSEKESQALRLTAVAAAAQSRANYTRAQSELDRAIAQLSQAKASLIERQSNEAFAKSTSQRWTTLSHQGAVSIQDADEKETIYKTSAATRQAAEDAVTAANSAVISAKATLKAEEANVNSAEANIAAATAHADRSTTERGFQNIISPFTGIITERNIDQGTLITSGSEDSKTPMFRLARIDTAKVYVDVPQYAARGIYVGQTIDVTLKEFPGKTFVGKVARTSFALDSTARTLRTEIHIPNQDLALAPGMYADVNFSITRPKTTFLVPDNSLVVRADGPQVVTLTEGKNIHYRSVKIGQDLGKQIEIVEGLSDKDTVLVNPSGSLAEGTLVSINQ